MEVKENTLSNRELAQMGFDGMLIDMIDAGPETKSFFNSVAHFHSIPVTKGGVDEQRVFERSEIKRMATRGRFLEIKRSQYDPRDFVISESVLSSIGLFSQFSREESTHIESKLRELDEKRAENRKKYREVMQKMEDAGAKLNEMYKVRNDYVERVGDLQRKKAQKEQLHLLIARNKEQVQGLKDFSVVEEEEAILEERVGAEMRMLGEVIGGFVESAMDRRFLRSDAAPLDV